MVDHYDDYHGTKVHDPFRWLEEDVRNSPDVAKWVEEQNAVTQTFLQTLPQREAIAAKLTELWNYERYSTPEEFGGKLFYTKNDGLQNQAVLYVQDGKHGEPKVLIDPNTWSEDGTKALASYVVSPKGTYLAYAVQDGGSDWRTWQVLEVASGKVLSDNVAWLKFNEVAWEANESGFFYARFPEPQSGQEFQSLNYNMAVYHHTLGDEQAQDKLIHNDTQNPEWGYTTAVTDDGRWLVVTVWHGTDSRYQIMYQDLQDENGALTYLIDDFSHEYSYLGSRDNRVFFQTTEQATLKRVVSVDLTQPDVFKEEVPQADFTLSNVAMSASYLITHYLEDAKSVLYAFDQQGQKREIKVPTIGSVAAISATTEHDDIYYAFSSFNYPVTLFAQNLNEGTQEVFKASEVRFNPEDFVVKQVFYTSKDGTRVPMTISHMKGVTPDKSLPTLLYGYGGFNIPVLPRFSLIRLTWMMMGGVYAQANIRGGGEYGVEWHKAGTKLQKQNVFDDFIAAAEYLIEQNYTNPDKLAIWGGSNGGLLVGAVTNQRPDLFAAAIPEVGVMDMLRFHQFTAGRYWVDDYGSADNPDEFKALYAYSPYHNVREDVEYPSVLVLTADTDDRVVPGHSFKYVAALQQAYKGKNPTMIRIETRAGHGAGIPTEKIIQEYADTWAFLANSLNMESMLK